jgi:hypothetical protein
MGNYVWKERSVIVPKTTLAYPAVPPDGTADGYVNSPSTVPQSSPKETVEFFS